jgi:mono/diheme cytochrome c family protein
MNYPIWAVPGAGLLIAGIAIFHVFISHFAVGGGLLLVWLERRARRADDPDLLAYVRRHSRVFLLLTLVFGAITGVGIWTTIALVHPQATSTLIQAFVWGWAIEWTFFIVEITAALVYYYGWDRLDARTHLAIGWIYFAAAWLSLAVINGILSFMLTPGRWIVTNAFWDGILNPTYLPTLVARTAGALALAGAYGLLTLAWTGNQRLKERLARPLAFGWVIPGTVLLMVSLVWITSAASAAGVPVAHTLGASAGFVDMLRALFATTSIGQPIARIAARVALNGMVIAVLIAIIVAVPRRTMLTRTSAVLMMIAALGVVGGLEWTREVLRKPYVISNYMLVSGLRVTGPPPFTVDDVRERGAIESARWLQQPAPEAQGIDREEGIGREVFRSQCAVCHTQNGYLAIKPLVRGASVTTLDRVIDQLATWRGRRMPPFAGTEVEHHALAVHLALMGGATREALAAVATARKGGAQVFEDNCALCHGPQQDFPFQAKGRSAEVFYEMIGRLPKINQAMPPFEGTDAERHELAEHLVILEYPRTGGGR